MTARRDRNWTIVSLHYRDPCPVDVWHPGGWKARCERYVVYEPLKSKAEAIVGAWLNAEPERAAHLEDVSYYPRNYVDLERALSRQGRVIA
jgi:hypothetical protein